MKQRKTKQEQEIDKRVVLWLKNCVLMSESKGNPNFREMKVLIANSIKAFEKGTDLNQEKLNQVLFKKYKEKLGKHFLTRVSGTGKEAFSFKMYEKGLVLKRANRGFIVLDKFDILQIKDMINEFLTKTELGEAI